MIPKTIAGVASTAARRPVRRILVVDDVPEIGALFKMVLRRLTTIHAVPTYEAKSKAAIARIRSEHYDLVITDLRLPDGSGEDVIAAARTASPPCPVILMSGRVDFSTRNDLAAVLPKPLSIDALIPLLDGLLSPQAGEQQASLATDPHLQSVPTAGEAHTK